jgi:hypothetical protein
MVQYLRKVTVYTKKRKTTGGVVFHWKLNFPNGFSRGMDRFHSIAGSNLDIGRLQMVCISNIK